MALHGIHLRRVSHPRYRWLATWKEEGRRRKKYFDKKTGPGGAEEWRDGKLAELQAQGTERGITDAERSAVVETREELAELGLDLREAVADAIARRRALATGVTVSSLADEYVRGKEKAGRTAEHTSEIARVLGGFADSFPDTAVSVVAAPEIEKWLHGLKGPGGKQLAAVTKRKRLSIVGSLFGFAVRRGHRANNPVDAIDRPSATAPKKGILNVKQAASLLDKAGEEILPAIALGLFAGLRDSEIKRLDWSDIDLDEETVTLSAEITKSGLPRFVPVEEALSAFLLPVARPAGPVWPPNGRKRHEMARTAARIRKWPNNALRHSFASYWLALHENAEALRQRMGQRSASVLFQHYAKLVRKKDAEAYWALRPGDEREKIVEIDAA